MSEASPELVAFVSSGRVDPRHKVCGRIEVGAVNGIVQCRAHGFTWSEAGCAWAVRVAGEIEALMSTGPAIPKAAYVEMCNEADREMLRAEAAEAERDALRAQFERVEALADSWAAESSKMVVGMVKRGCAIEVRDILSSSEPVTAGEGERWVDPLAAHRHGGEHADPCPYCPPAGEVTPPAEQRAYVYDVTCIACRTGKHPAPAPTTEGGQP